MTMGAHFNGPDYDPALDGARLGNQHERIKALMIDGVWRTVGEIHALLPGYPENSISAQVRHLRKARFGSWIVERRHRCGAGPGLNEYRVLAPATNALEWP